MKPEEKKKLETKKKALEKEIKNIETAEDKVTPMSRPVLQIFLRVFTLFKINKIIVVLVGMWARRQRVCASCGVCKNLCVNTKSQ